MRNYIYCALNILEQMQRIMRGKKTEKKGIEDVERTNQATCEGPSKRKQKQSKVNITNIKTLSYLYLMN